MEVEPKFGRLRADDRRDAGFPMSAVLPPKRTGVTRRFWGRHWTGFQGVFPHCVGYAWVHWLEYEPVTHGEPHPIIQPKMVYHEAQKVDEWPGEGYEGTSVRAGAKVLKSLGFIDSYHWASDVSEVIRAVLDIGPVVVGTWWYSGMMRPNRQGFVRPVGIPLGGHAYLIDGANSKRGFLRIRNSWEDWGVRGRGTAKIKTRDFDRLIKRDGEVCLAIETQRDA